MIGAYDVYRGDILEVGGVPVVVEIAPLLGGPYLTDLTRKDTIRLNMVVGGVLGSPWDRVRCSHS